MAVYYTNLWKSLVEKKKKPRLRGAAHISTNAVAKLGRNKSDSPDTLNKYVPH